MDFNRRDFLKKGVIATLASFIPFKLKAQNTLDCEPTTSDILGPFFSEGAPETNSIIPEDYHERLFYLNLSLQVVIRRFLTVWISQADEHGDYDNVGFNYRGKIITDENGNIIYIHYSGNIKWLTIPTISHSFKSTGRL